MHFLAVAAQVMRRILVDHARHRTRDKRGGTMVAVAIDEALDVKVATHVDIVKLDDAMTDLAGIFPDQARKLAADASNREARRDMASALGGLWSVCDARGDTGHALAYRAEAAEILKTTATL